jgi:hypothetical protein
MRHQSDTGTLGFESIRAYDFNKSHAADRYLDGYCFSPSEVIWLSPIAGNQQLEKSPLCQAGVSFGNSMSSSFLSRRNPCSIS